MFGATVVLLDAGAFFDEDEPYDSDGDGALVFVVGSGPAVGVGAGSSVGVVVGAGSAVGTGVVVPSALAALGGKTAAASATKEPMIVSARLRWCIKKIPEFKSMT